MKTRTNQPMQKYRCSYKAFKWNKHSQKRKLWVFLQHEGREMYYSDSWEFCVPVVHISYLEVAIFIFSFHSKSMSVPVMIYNFWPMGPGTSCFQYQWVPTANLWVLNTIFNDKSAIFLHPGLARTRWNKNLCAKDAGCAGNKTTGVRVRLTCRTECTYMYCLVYFYAAFSRVLRK